MTTRDDHADAADGPRRELTRAHAYWRANLRLVASLLAVWFAVSFGCGILFVEPLNRIEMFGFPLGFWFAQQGAIFVFVLLVFFYAAAMRRIDRRYGLDDDERETG